MRVARCSGHLAPRCFIRDDYIVRVTIGGKELAPSSLSKYTDVSLRNKMLDLDEPWFSINLATLDNELQNAIAQNKIDYDDVSQTITYYPKLEGMVRKKKF